MPSLIAESFRTLSNPMDIAEQAVMDRDLAYERLSDEELVAEVTTSWCNYRIWLTWQEQLNALMFTCTMETKQPMHMQNKLYPLLGMVNAKLWIGHFDLCAEEGVVTFRHTLLLKGSSGATLEQVEDLIEIATGECDRFYPAFQSVVWGGKTPEEAMTIALFDTAGEA